MAFPSGKSKDTLNKAFNDTQVHARNLKIDAIEIVNTTLAGNITRKVIMDFNTKIADALDIWNNASVKVGIEQYAKDQLEDQTLTLAADFVAMKTTAEATRDWIIANFPNTGGLLLERSFDVNGRMVLATLTTAQTAGLRTELNLLIATIED